MVGHEFSFRVTIEKIGRPALGIALKTAWLVEVGSPLAVTKTLIYRPERDHQTATLQSHTLLGAMSLHPISGPLERQSQERPYRRQVQPFVVRPFCDHRRLP